MMPSTLKGIHQSNDACSLIKNQGNGVELEEGKKVFQQPIEEGELKISSKPIQPLNSDHLGWQRFLAAYQSGRWDVDQNSLNSSIFDQLISPKSSLVIDFQGNSLENKDYFNLYNHLAAPPLPFTARKKRHDALLRHGIVQPHTRHYLQRYVEMAKRVFDCDLVTISFASADEKHIIFLAADGPPLSKVPNCASICSHALLLKGKKDIFVIPDMADDWRFEKLFGKDGLHQEMNYRFHASAPIYLSSSETPCCKEIVSTVHAGRFGIFSSKPRSNSDFTLEDAKCLLDFARMTEEAMENEFLTKFAKETRRLRQDFVNITAALNKSLENRLLFHATTTTNNKRSNFNPNKFRKNSITDVLPNSKEIYNNILDDVDEMQTFTDMIHSSLSASTVCLLNMSNLPSVLSLLERTMDEKRATDFGRRSKFDQLGKFDDEISLVAYSGNSSLLPDYQSNSSKDLLKEWFENRTTKSNRFQSQSQLFIRDQLSKIQSNKTEINKNQIEFECPYGVHLASNKDKIIQPCCCLTSKAELISMIDPILPNQVETCLIIPIKAENSINQKKVPKSVLCILWDSINPISAAEMDFCSSLISHLTSLACQEQTSATNSYHFNLIHVMQHELRTPLNGILGVSEILREKSQDGSDRMEKNLNWNIQSNDSSKNNNPRDQIVKAAKVLTTELESIHVSSLMLKKILDDAFSLDNIFKENEGKGKLNRKNDRRSSRNSFDLIKMVENICYDELQYFDLEAMRNYRVIKGVGSSVSTSGSNITPTKEIIQKSLAATAELMHRSGSQEIANEISSSIQTNQFIVDLFELSLPAPLLIKIEKQLTDLQHLDQEKVQTILAKLINNSLRFTKHDGFIELIIKHVQHEEMLKNLESKEEQCKDEKENGQIPSILCSTYEDSLDQIYSTKQSWIQISLKDTGIGMDRNFLYDGYLKPFEKANEFSQGIGFGCTVAFHLVISMDGIFTVKSEKEIGTEIDIFLPYIDDNRIDNEINSIKQQENSQNSIFQTVTFLGFDEEVGTKHLSETLKSILKEKRIHYQDGPLKQDEENHNQSMEKHLFIIHENALYSPNFVSPSSLGRKNTYTMIFERNALKLRRESEILTMLKSSMHVSFTPPFGPNTWSTFMDLLQNVPINEEVQSEIESLNEKDIEISPPKSDLLQSSEENSTKEEDYFSMPINEEGENSLALEDSISRQSSPQTEAICTPMPDSLMMNTVIESVSETEDQQKEQKIQKNSPFFVLVVEDNPINMRLMTGVLRKLRCPYAEAYDGKEAIEKFKIHLPALVLLDISLPLMNGFDACIAMREHPTSFKPQIIAITAYSTPEDKHRGINICGMDEWHTKPVSISSLRTLIKKAQTEYEELINGKLENEIQTKKGISH